MPVTMPSTSITWRRLVDSVRTEKPTRTGVPDRPKMSTPSDSSKASSISLQAEDLWDRRIVLSLGE